MLRSLTEYLSEFALKFHLVVFGYVSREVVGNMDMVLSSIWNVLDFEANTVLALELQNICNSSCDGAKID